MAGFVVVTRTFYEPELRDRILEAGRGSLPIFEKQAGLKSIRMHENHDRTHTMTMLVWRSREDHEACMSSPDFGAWGAAWEELMSSGKARWELETYEIIGDYDAD